MRKRHLVLAAATVSVAAFGMSRQAFAASYASQVSVTGSALSFDLSEGVNGSVPGSTNGDVKVFYNGTSQDLGALAAGQQSVTLSAAPTTPVQVEVTTNDGNGFLSANTQNTFESTALEIDPAFVAGGHGAVLVTVPRGVAVVNDPTSPAFGRIYVGNAGTNTNTNLPQVGVYGLNPDFTFVGANATEATGPVTELGQAAGLTFGGGSSDPWRMTVGPDGYLYISSWHDASGGMLRAQITASGLANGSNVFSQSGLGSPNHGDIVSASVIHGSTLTGDLTVTAIDPYFKGGYGVGPDSNQIFTWTVGASTVYAGQPTKVLDVSTGYQVTDPSGGLPYIPLDTRFWSPQNLYNATGNTSSAHWYNDFGGVDFDLAQGGPDNQFYVAQSRTTGNQPDLFVLSSDQSHIVWDSLDATIRQGLLPQTDYLSGAYSEAVSPDGRFLLVGQSGSVTASLDYSAYVVPLLAGMPDLRLSQPFAAEPAGFTYRQPAYDAAGNVYAIASFGTTATTIGAYGAGGNSVTVTGSNGTFTASGQWTANANGNLSNTANWLVGNLPNGKDQVLTFGATTTAQRTVSVDANQMAGAIVFSSPNGYTLSNGGGSLNMNGLGANFTANKGNNTIAAPVTVNTDLGLYAASGASLTISGPITYATVTQWSNTAMPDVVKNGAGTVSVSNLNLVQSDIGDKTSGNLDIYGGKLVLLANSTAPAVVSELSVFTGQGASLDLTNNDLIYDYNLNTYTTKSPIGVIEGLVASGGIFTSTGGVKAGTGLAVVENNSTYLGANTFGSFDGQGINAESSTGGTVLVKYTYFGDLNLDGKVDGTDFALMGSGLTGWGGGDLNYATDVNGNYNVVTADDWSLFQLGAAEYGAGHVQLPEPASVALLGLAAIPMIRRRRA